jgi:hypothetical protein
MALIGGGGSGAGGAGNVAGGTFSGGSNTLEILGDFCYVYVEEFTADSSGVVRMQFTTGAYFTVGRIRFAGFTNMGSPAGSGQVGSCRVKLNGQTIIDLHTEGQTKDMPFSDTADLLVPPFTKVECLVDAGSTQSDEHGSLSYVGRIYA